MPRALVFAVLAFVPGCSSELDRGTAAELLEGHVEALAPNTLDGETFTIAVQEILTSSDVHREVRFRTISARVDSSGVARRDTGQVTTAHFQRSDEGWSISRYGLGMVDAVARIVAEEWEAEYEDLLPTAKAMRRAARAWSTQQLQRLQESEVVFDRAVWEAFQRGISEDGLRTAMQSAGDDLSAFEWGIAGEATDSAVAWVRRADSSEVVCAFRVGDADSRSLQYFWVDETWVTCSGAERTYTEIDAVDDARAWILENGGILYPESR